MRLSFATPIPSGKYRTQDRETTKSKYDGGSTFTRVIIISARGKIMKARLSSMHQFLRQRAVHFSFDSQSFHFIWMESANEVQLENAMRTEFKRRNLELLHIRISGRCAMADLDWLLNRFYHRVDPIWICHRGSSQDMISGISYDFTTTIIGRGLWDFLCFRESTLQEIPSNLHMRSPNPISSKARRRIGFAQATAVSKIDDIERRLGFYEDVEWIDHLSIGDGVKSKCVIMEPQGRRSSWLPCRLRGKIGQRRIDSCIRTKRWYL